MAAKKAEAIELKPIEIKSAIIRIEGITPLILHKMSKVNRQTLIDKQSGRTSKSSKMAVDKWAEAISTITWANGEPDEYSEQAYIDALKNNKPCISGAGLKASFCEAVVRFAINSFSTQFKATVHLVHENIPIEFTTCVLEEKLIPAKMGSPILSYQNKFFGWSAEFEIRFTEDVYSLSQIIDIINRAGFGIGIGSRRPGKCQDDYGTYRVAAVTIIETNDTDVKMSDSKKKRREERL